MTQQTLEGFMGIKFGSSIEAAKEIMMKKPNCTLDSENSNPNRLVFDNLQFAGREALFIDLRFVDDKFHTSYVYIQPKLETQTVDLYSEIKDEINSKYYKTDADYETYKSPYEKDDGHTETAISLGKALFSAFWKFKNPNAPNNDVDNYITLNITENMQIQISYQDGILVDLYVEKQREINSADY